MSEYGIAAFRSRQQVMKMEEILRREGLRTEIVTTPREVAVGCGLSVRFDVRDIRTVQNILMRTRPSNLIGLYLVSRMDGRTHLRVISRQG